MKFPALATAIALCASVNVYAGPVEQNCGGVTASFELLFEGNYIVPTSFTCNETGDDPIGSDFVWSYSEGELSFITAATVTPTSIVYTMDTGFIFGGFESDPLWTFTLDPGLIFDSEPVQVLNTFDEGEQTGGGTAYIVGGAPTQAIFKINGGDGVGYGEGVFKAEYSIEGVSQVAVVPEPETLLLAMTSLGFLAATRRRRYPASDVPRLVHGA